MGGPIVRVSASVLVALLIGPLVYAQALASAKPVFEVAAIRPNKDGERPSLLSSPGGRTVAIDETLKYLIGWAYNVQDYQISGGPKWIDSVGYDIDAKSALAIDPGPDTLGYFRQMLQSLLEDRFKLTIRHTTQELSIYLLVVSKGGAKLAEREKPANPTDMRMSGGRGVMVAQRIPLWLLAQSLSGILARPVTDQTGLKGYYDFRLQWTPDEASPAASSENAGPSIFTAVQEQLGLRLETVKGPEEVLIIDHVESPSEN